MIAAIFWGCFWNGLFFAIGLIIGVTLVFHDAVKHGVCKHVGGKTGFVWLNKVNKKEDDE